MDDWKMEVYSPALELLGILESYRSATFTERAFTAGTFTLDCVITPQTKEMLAPDNVIWFLEDSAGVIECLEERADNAGPYMTVKGRTLTGVLDWRILWGRYDMSGSPQAIMRALAEDCAIHPTRGDVQARIIPGSPDLPSLLSG